MCYCFFSSQPLTCHLCCHLPVLFVVNVAVLILLFVFAMASASYFTLLCYTWSPLILDSLHLFAENEGYHRHFSIKGILGPSHVCFILRPSHVCFILRYSSNWNLHRLHSELFPPKENHNVGPLGFDDDHDHICFSLRRFKYLAERSNVVIGRAKPK
jgi:hypothetical protein